MKFTKSLMSVSAVAVLMAALLPAQAMAHRQWLKVSTAQVEGKSTYVTVDAGVSENLFELDSFTLKLDGLTITGPDGAAVQPENPYTGKLRSSFDLNLTAQGTYKISLVNDSAMASYTVAGEQKRFRGTEEQLARDVPANAENLNVTRASSRVETFVTLGKPNDVALKATGKGLELVPLSATGELVVGEAARFRLLKDGKPAAGLVVAVVPGGVRYRGALKDTSVTTDAKGEFSVSWTVAGPYWIGASYPARRPMGAGGPQGGPPGNPQAAGPQSGATPPAQNQAPPERRLSYSATLEVLPF
jgi:uncharacterized GH25 family protein